MGNTVWNRIRKVKRTRVSEKFVQLKQMTETVSTYHSDFDVRRQAMCESLRQSEYISMATEYVKGQNTINKDILNRCNKLYHHYLLLMKDLP